MDTLDLGTVAGITAATGFLIQILKVLLIDKLNLADPFRAVILTGFTIFLAVGISFAASIAAGATINIGAILTTGITSGIAAAGGFEAIKNSWNLFVK